MGGSKFLQNEVKNMVLCIARYYVLLYICAKVVNTMYAENVKSQMRKGMLEYSIMLLLKEKPYYSSDIIEELEESNLIVVEGTLYPLLSRLKKEGMLDYEWQESAVGPPRKYYRLTESGREALALLDEYYSRLAESIAQIREKSNPL